MKTFGQVSWGNRVWGLAVLSGVLAGAVVHAHEGNFGDIRGQILDRQVREDQRVVRKPAREAPRDNSDSGKSDCSRKKEDSKCAN